MRLKWIGLALLLFDLVLAPLRSNSYSPVLMDIMVVAILVAGLVLIMIDCRRDDMEYIKKKALEKSGKDKGGAGAHF